MARSNACTADQHQDCRGNGDMLGCTCPCHDVDEPCIICGRPAVTYYPPHDDEAAPSCGGVRCELTMQAAQDHHDECGSR